MPLTIEITSDFMCPWCLIAESRLHRAIAQLDPATDIQTVWRPFELNPTMPAMGINRKTYRTKKFGSWEYSQRLDAQTIQAAQGDSIPFRYDLMEITPNTLKAHRLTWFAGQQNKATKMAARILRAYFTEGQNIADVDVLASLADEIGLDKTSVKAFLLSEAGTEEVREFERQAKAQGIHGVPSIRIGKEALSGAQPVEVFVTALRTAIDELTEVRS